MTWPLLVQPLWLPFLLTSTKTHTISANIHAHTGVMQVIVLADRLGTWPRTLSILQYCKPTRTRCACPQSQWVFGWQGTLRNVLCIFQKWRINLLRAYTTTTVTTANSTFIMMLPPSSFNTGETTASMPSIAFSLQPVRTATWLRLMLLSRDN